jgi:hypothetical protein
MWNIFNKKQNKTKRTLIPPHTFSYGDYVTAEVHWITEKDAPRKTKYAEVLQMTIEDYAKLFSDDDLEEAVYLLTQYAKSRNYNIIGTSRQVLSKLFDFSERMADGNHQA